MRDALMDRGLVVEPQRLIEFVGHVDLWVEERMVVEIDGYAFHSSREALGEDSRRNNALTLSGIPFLRFPAVDALRDPDLVAARIEAALRGRTNLQRRHPR
ncbi:endonuclease domain-containing protein [Demequina litorisediminis]|uniref:endonuclease domain-containing protein n=1 Tax=Demequina litorisediminis TaxID=1849022 RepID=UPI0024E0CC39|nr:DUF559 domain-containing protein [Demequina litorisediminis]